jgi:uncharacterized protein (TIGR02145 family)
MERQPEKTDWSFLDKIDGDDLNRIEGNIDYLYNTTGIYDIEGNRYRVVVINDRLWTIDNWRCTKYNDGTSIPNIVNDTSWSTDSVGAYCKYNHDLYLYGFYYNWYAVNGSGGAYDLAPDGWRVANGVDYTSLETFLTEAGYSWDLNTTNNYISKSLASQQGWDANSAANPSPGYDPWENNTSLFNMPPSGYRKVDGAFDGIGSDGFQWSGSEHDSSNASYQRVRYNTDTMDFIVSSKRLGFPVRMCRSL